MILESFWLELAGWAHTSKTDIIVVLKPVDSIDFASYIVFSSSVEQILDGRVLFVASKNLLGFLRPAVC